MDVQPILLVTVVIVDVANLGNVRAVSASNTKPSELRLLTRYYNQTSSLQMPKSNKIPPKSLALQ